MKRSSTPVRYCPPRAWPSGASSMAGVIFQQTRKVIYSGWLHHPIRIGFQAKYLRILRCRDFFARHRTLFVTYELAKRATESI